MALIYIDRLIQRNNFLLTELNVHRVVITSVMLAAKVREVGGGRRGREERERERRCF